MAMWSPGLKNCGSSAKANAELVLCLSWLWLSNPGRELAVCGLCTVEGADPMLDNAVSLFLDQLATASLALTSYSS